MNVLCATYAISYDCRAQYYQSFIICVYTGHECFRREVDKTLLNTVSLYLLTTIRVVCAVVLIILK